MFQGVFIRLTKTKKWSKGCSFTGRNIVSVAYSPEIVDILPFKIERVLSNKSLDYLTYTSAFKLWVCIEVRFLIVVNMFFPGKMFIFSLNLSTKELASHPQII